MKETITLDGRQFVGMTKEVTAAQDDYIFGHLRQAGAMGDDGAERTKEQRAEKMLTTILLSGRKHFLVAGAFTEEGKVWNRVEADANAERFAAITSTEEKKAMQSSIVALVIGFFMSGEQSLGTSPNASSGTGKAPKAKNARKSSAPS
jgi:hypothetical protein